MPHSAEMFECSCRCMWWRTEPVEPLWRWWWAGWRLSMPIGRHRIQTLASPWGLWLYQPQYPTSQMSVVEENVSMSKFGAILASFWREAIVFLSFRLLSDRGLVIWWKRFSHILEYGWELPSCKAEEGGAGIPLHRESDRLQVWPVAQLQDGQHHTNVLRPQTRSGGKCSDSWDSFFLGLLN